MIGEPVLRVERVSLRYGSVTALDDVSFDVMPGGILCLLGASGSGKSSALRLIAGLERPSSGRILIQERIVASDDSYVEPELRGVGMVFQDFALFPHLTVEENVAFGIRSSERTVARRTVNELLHGVGLADRARSYPHMLSGGERQRVALARALAPKPRVLLMDEPFSSLDSRLRDQVRQQTVDVLRRTGTTTILVTHDPIEAMRVSDRVGVLSHGRLVQLGTASDLYQRPCSPEMAAAFGPINIVDGAVEDGAVQTPLGGFLAPADAISGPAVICVRPQHITIGPGAAGVGATVVDVTPVGEGTEVQLRINGVHVVAKVPERTAIAVGDTPQVHVDPSKLLVFPLTRTSRSATA